MYIWFVSDFFHDCVTGKGKCNKPDNPPPPQHSTRFEARSRKFLLIRCSTIWTIWPPVLNPATTDCYGIRTLNILKKITHCTNFSSSASDILSRSFIGFRFRKMSLAIKSLYKNTDFFFGVFFFIMAGFRQGFLFFVFFFLWRVKLEAYSLKSSHLQMILCSK